MREKRGRAGLCGIGYGRSWRLFAGEGRTPASPRGLGNHCLSLSYEACNEKCCYRHFLDLSGRVSGEANRSTRGIRGRSSGASLAIESALESVGERGVEAGRRWPKVAEGGRSGQRDLIEECRGRSMIARLGVVDRLLRR